METELDEMRTLGVVGICKEAYTITKLHVRLFLSLGLTLVLPLGAIMFYHGLLSDPLLRKINHNEQVLESETVGSSARNETQKLLDGELVGLGLITVIYVIFVLAFSLLSTASIVYTVASIYTSKGLSYKKILSVVPKVWKRLFMTFLWAHVLIFLYNVAFVFIFVVLLVVQSQTGIPLTVLFIPLGLMFYCLLVYIYLVWHLASVVTVLEDSYGISALKKSADLIEGKRWVGWVMILIHTVATVVVLTLFNLFVRSPELRMESGFGRLLLAVTLLGLWTVVTVLGIVVQTIVYFVCKSVHLENIDRGLLSEHLDGYLGEYMPLKGPIVSLESLEEAELEDVSPLPVRSNGGVLNKV